MPSNLQFAALLIMLLQPNMHNYIKGSTAGGALAPPFLLFEGIAPPPFMDPIKLARINFGSSSAM